MSDDESNLPSAQECQRRVEQFVELTCTDEMMAQFYLQDRDWNVERSVQAYFDEKVAVDGESSSQTADDDSGDESTPPKQAKFEEKKEATQMTGSKSTMEALTFISWNIDGLSEKGLKVRTQSVIQTVLERNPDIIFFQEVVPETLGWLKTALDTKYLFGQGGNDDRTPGCYFTVVLLKRSTVYRESLQVIKFEDSVMSRDLTLVEAAIDGRNFLLINTHLESTKDFAEVRMDQLKRAFNHVKKANSSKTVILAGDLNIRDSEVSKVGLPENVQDMWVANGSRKEVEHTWDTLRNNNVEIPSKFKPRLRFDRVYLRPSQSGDIKPEHFGLVGIQKVPGHQLFPSDHWGIYCVFKFLKTVK